MINKETFKTEDENNILALQKLIDTNQIKPRNSISYTDNFGINFPAEVIAYKLESKKIAKRYFENFHVNIHSMDNVKHTYWTEHTDYLGIYADGNFDLYLKTPEIKKIALCWIVIHEFRHHMQYINPNICTCQENSNYEALKSAIIESFGISDPVYNHVFHEIIPYEVDANTFACEVLNIDYPGSKFNVTEYSLDCLKNNKL